MRKKDWLSVASVLSAFVGVTLLTFADLLAFAEELFWWSLGGLFVLACFGLGMLSRAVKNKSSANANAQVKVEG